MLQMIEVNRMIWQVQGLQDQAKAGSETISNILEKFNNYNDIYGQSKNCPNMD